VALKDRLVDPNSPERRPRRAAYALPTLFTAGNIFLGFLAILRAFHGSMLAATGDAVAASLRVSARRPGKPLRPGGGFE